MFDTFNWVDSAFGSLKSRSHVISLDEYRRTIRQNNIGSNPNAANYFRSYFRFERHFYEYFIKKDPPSVAGYSGLHIFDFLFLDIDGKSIQEATDKLKKALEISDSFGITVLCAFSGTKGFHLYIPSGLFNPTPDPDNFKFLKKFSHLLFGDLADLSNYEINRLLRQPGTLNRKDNTDQYGFKNFLKPEEITEILHHPELVFDICKEPSPYLIEEDLLCKFYWTAFTPNDKLISLWERAKEESKPKRTVVHAGGWKAKGTPQCVSNILSMIRENDPRLDGWKNNAFAILTIYFKDQLPVESALRSMLHDLNNSLERPHDPRQLDATITSVLKHNYSGWGCGSEDSTFGALYFCRGESGLAVCPQQNEKDSAEEKLWADSGRAFESMLIDLKNGPGNINLGIDEFDEVYKFFKPGDTLVFIGVSTVGKSILMYRLMRHWVKIAKERDEIVLFSLPEQNEAEAAKRITMQLGGFTLKELYLKVQNGGLPEHIRDWFATYKEHLILQHSIGFTIHQWEALFDKIEKTYRKKIMLAFFDGLKFMGSGEVKGFNRYEDLARDIVTLANRKNLIIAVNHHVPKVDMAKKTAGMDETQVEPGMHSGFGSTNFTDMFTYVLTLFRDGNHNLCVRMRKAKQIWNHKRKLPTVKFFLLDSYNIMTAKEIQEKGIIDQFPESIAADIEFELLNNNKDIVPF